MTALEERLLGLAIVSAHNLYHACLVGNAPPRIREMYDLVKHPRVGDLVVEITTGAVWYQRGESVDRARYMGPIEDKIGRLVKMTQVPQREPEEGEDPADIPMQDGWVIERLTDASRITWTNASFIRLPEGALT